jgi:ribosomal protein L32
MPDPPAMANAPTGGLIKCQQCGHDVPRTDYCVRCGDPLSDESGAEVRAQLRGRFAAAPDERARSIALVSTLFPQLPRAQMRTFRLAVVAGLAIVVLLSAGGLFPLALVAAAFFVPLLMVIYLYAVDVYEDEPLPIIGATMIWGALAGVASGLLLRSAAAGPLGAAGVTGGMAGAGTGEPAALLIAGVVVPLLEGVLMIAGPLVLLPARRFNDVLDGATFGAASAVSFGGAQLLVQSWGMLGAGLRPAGDPLEWSVQLVSLGLLQPVIAAGTIGAVAAAVWLRYRAPVADRHALGAVGRPLPAVILGGAILVLAGLARAALPLLPETLVMGGLAAVALYWLRLTIHLGLRQEAAEIEIGPEVDCPNCGRATPSHAFCGRCGINLRALPRNQRPGSGRVR